MLMDQAKLAKRIEDVVRMRTILHPKDWQDESQLMMTRWFDYRFMSPIEATMAFARYYIAGLRSYVRRHVDRELSETVSGIRSGVPTARVAWFTALWRARARTDAIFVPYDLLIDFSFDFSSRRKRYWTMLPHQLHASPKNGEAWWAVFDDAVEDLLPRRMRTVADMPHYRIENDLGLPAQRHFRDLILSEMRHQYRMLNEQIADWVFVKRHLTLEQVLSLAPVDADRSEIERRARAEAEDRAWEVRPVIKLDKADLLPSCFAVAETINETRAPCDTCALVDHCKTAAAEAIEITIRTTGSGSPVLSADRARKRLNTQKCRSKTKPLPAGSSVSESD
ncbi:hypothetical protein [Neorhizobium sp. T6_25]|uniref:hypothetical protein n=1 Tax=Neorhizobium sp. T6_25 TaxID=2093833 RepID=UPI000CF877CF|nr:hypothetical protein [Neorhizobium sp. T6_25]